MLRYCTALTSQTALVAVALWEVSKLEILDPVVWKMETYKTPVVKIKAIPSFR